MGEADGAGGRKERKGRRCLYLHMCFSQKAHGYSSLGLVAVTVLSLVTSRSDLNRSN